MSETKSLKVTLTKSRIGRLPKQVATLDALGLRKIQQSRVLPDNACVRGMIRKVEHMVLVEEVQ